MYSDNGAICIVHYHSDSRKICPFPHEAVASSHRRTAITCPYEKAISPYPIHCTTIFCWAACCTSCVGSIESFAVHANCFNVFKAVCNTDDVLNRLFTLVDGRRPWDGAPHIQVIPNGADGAMRELGHETAEGVGLPQLLRLPPELLRVVGHMLASTAFGQAIVAKQCGREMGKAPRPAQSLVYLPLQCISSWARGGQPILCESRSNDLPAMLLTYDWRGIRQIERLSSRDAPRRWRRTFGMAYTVLEEEDIIRVMAYFKVAFVSRKRIPCTRSKPDHSSTV